MGVSLRCIEIRTSISRRNPQPVIEKMVSSVKRNEATDYQDDREKNEQKQFDYLTKKAEIFSALGTLVNII